jgi:hypothetical protein
VVQNLFRLLLQLLLELMDLLLELAVLLGQELELLFVTPAAIATAGTSPQNTG